MREIKFRYVWQHEETGRIATRVFTLDEIQAGHAQFANFNDFSRYVLIYRNQYTGLYDKNGVEIYDGDLVKWTINGNEIIAPVEYFEDSACFFMADEIGGGYGGVYNDWLRGEYEVTGNIYEGDNNVAI